MSALPDPDQLAAWQAFLLAHATVVRTLEEEMEEDQGLPLVWYDVLVQVARNGGRLRMNELADAVLLSRSNITRMVDRMASARLITRESCPEDRRGMYAVLTPEGMDTLKRANPGHRRGIMRHFAQHLNQDEIRTIRAALSKIVEAETARPYREID